MVETEVHLVRVAIVRKKGRETIPADKFGVGGYHRSVKRVEKREKRGGLDDGVYVR
jgi:hypothetical protein